MSFNSSTGAWLPTHNLHAAAMSEANAWRGAVDLCASRIRSSGADQQLDARLFLLALRQFMKAAQMASEAVQGSGDEQPLATARDQFNRTLPGAKAACDVIEHFREYARGIGDLQQRGPRSSRQDDPIAAARDWPLGYDPGTDRVVLGQYEVPVAAA